MATQHAKVIDALMTIFKSLSLAAVPYLPKVGVCSACCVWCALTRSCSVLLLDLSCGAVPTRGGLLLRVLCVVCAHALVLVLLLASSLGLARTVYIHRI